MRDDEDVDEVCEGNENRRDEENISGARDDEMRSGSNH